MNALNPRERMIRRLNRLLVDARRTGLVLVVDANAIGVRVLTREEREGADDLNALGELVQFPDACGGGHAVSRGNACNFGNN